jgi:trehalose 6-phosphate phosphatase
MTPHLLRHLHEVRAVLKRSSCFWLGTDFDGTLTYHQEDPETVLLPVEMKSRLIRLNELPMTRVAVISGRCLSDITKRVGLPQLAYAGNHGLEISAPGLQWIDPDAMRHQIEMAAFADTAKGELGTFVGAYVENKSLSISIDYRACRFDDRPLIVERLNSFKSRFSNIRLRHSQFGSEALPRTTTNKGTAAKRLSRCPDHPQIASIYLGDDLTDEDAFSALNGAITVRVGGGTTSARYRVDSPNDVGEFFDWLHQEIGGLVRAAASNPCM